MQTKFDLCEKQNLKNFNLNTLLLKYLTIINVIYLYKQIYYIIIFFCDTILTRYERHANKMQKIINFCKKKKFEKF